MSKLSHLTDSALDRVLELAGQAGDSLKNGSSGAAGWLKTGAAVGALKTGGRMATRVARRNPGTAVALAAVGVGLLGYAAYRKRKQAQLATAPVDGQSRHVADRPHVHIDDAADIDAR